MTPVFGDLARPARTHLAAAVGAPDGLSCDDVITAAWISGRIARTLMRHLADITAPWDMVDAIRNPGLDPRMRAAVNSREALRMAALTLQRATRQTTGAPGTEVHPLVEQLRMAGQGLAAGRDLLGTHFTIGPSMIRMAQSDWSAVIESGPVTRAVLADVAAWARQLALLAARLALAEPLDAPVPVPVQHGLAGACNWLLTGSGALTAAQRSDPVRDSDTSLLAAIPAAFMPPRLPPREGESTVGLAEGIAVSAARLRAISWVTAERAAWSPTMTADSWRWKATAAAVVCHISERVLGALAASPAADAAGLGETARLQAASEAAGRAWERWRDVAAAWNDISTDTRGLTGPGIPDAGDMMVRLGRIAFTDPAWAPGRDHRGQLRHPDDLAPDAQRFRIVLGAAHRALDALAVAGAADERAVGTAIRASRFYVPVRTLPEGYDQPYRFWRPVPGVTAAVLDAYEAANQAAAQAAARIDAVALTAGTPSCVLGMARTAVVGRAGVKNEQQQAEPDELGEAAPDHRAGRAAQELPGPVEQAIRRLRATDPVLLLRARAVDRAGRALIRDAKAAAPRQARMARSRAARNAAGLAGQAFPHGHAGLLALPQKAPPRSPKPSSTQPRTIAPGTARPR